MIERNRNKNLLEYGIYVLAFVASYISSRAGLYMLSGVLLIAVAGYLYVSKVLRSGCLVEMRALFSLSWVGGQGIACFQLSKLQSDWSNITWLCFFLIYTAFTLGYEWRFKNNKDNESAIEKNDTQAKRLFQCMIFLVVTSALCFIFEAVKVGYIPVFSDLPHAYSYFHVSGVHYFTISCILIPAITVLYVKVCSSISKKMGCILILFNVYAVMIPFLCVSRFQLLFAVGFAVVTYIVVNRSIKLRTIIILAVVMVPVYVILTVFRNHDVTYLNGIFEMKNANTPIFITQPYMYVANNYENFNCMVEQLTQHTWGLKMLFPVFALSGLKFVFPQLVSFPIYITKPELTTLTMFYDAYYDFGIVGVIVLALIVGFVAKKLMSWIREKHNPVIYLFYGQIAIYLGLSFFTTWFSNPTTWFWLVLTGMMYVFVGYDKKNKIQ